MVGFLKAPPARPTTRRFDIPAIAHALYGLQRDFPSINPMLLDRRDPMIDAVLENMVAGYERVDRLIAEGVDLFAMGESRRWLDLNCIVLCGVDTGHGECRPGHQSATEAHFYDDGAGGIRDVAEWYERHRGETLWDRAAGVYIRMLCEPQLFLEGNHRTGVLIVSYLLGREGLPPLVLTASNAHAFFDPSTQIKQARRGSMALLFGMHRMKERFGEFLRTQADERFLLPAA